MEFRRYRRRPDQAISAVQLNLDTPGLFYRKWGSDQHGKQGDWLVDNAGEVYTVERVSFERTYRCVSPGRYIKVAPVYACQMQSSGQVRTKEGVSHYGPGDYVVCNEPDGADQYAVAHARFHAMYELAEEDGEG